MSVYGASLAGRRTYVTKTGQIGRYNRRWRNSFRNGHHDTAYTLGTLLRKPLASSGSLAPLTLLNTTRAMYKLNKLVCKTAPHNPEVDPSSLESHKLYQQNWFLISQCVDRIAIADEDAYRLSAFHVAYSVELASRLPKEQVKDIQTRVAESTKSRIMTDSFRTEPAKRAIRYNWRHCTAREFHWIYRGLHRMDKLYEDPEFESFLREKLIRRRNQLRSWWIPNIVQVMYELNVKAPEHYELLISRAMSKSMRHTLLPDQFSTLFYIAQKVGLGCTNLLGVLRVQLCFKAFDGTMSRMNDEKLSVLIWSAMMMRRDNEGYVKNARAMFGKLFSHLASVIRVNQAAGKPGLSTKSVELVQETLTFDYVKGIYDDAGRVSAEDHALLNLHVFGEAK